MVFVNSGGCAWNPNRVAVGGLKDGCEPPDAISGSACRPSGLTSCLLPPAANYQPTDGLMADGGYSVPSIILANVDVVCCSPLTTKHQTPTINP